MPRGWPIGAADRRMPSLGLRDEVPSRPGPAELAGGAPTCDSRRGARAQRSGRARLLRPTGFSQEHAAKLRLMSCPWCTKMYPATSSKEGFAPTSQKCCPMLSHLKKCNNRDGRDTQATRSSTRASANRAAGAGSRRREAAASSRRARRHRLAPQRAQNVRDACSVPGSIGPAPAHGAKSRSGLQGQGAFLAQTQAPAEGRDRAPVSEYERDHLQRGEQNRCGAWEAGERAMAAYRASQTHAAAATAEEEGPEEEAEEEATQAPPTEEEEVAHEKPYCLVRLCLGIFCMSVNLPRSRGGCRPGASRRIRVHLIT